MNIQNNLKLDIEQNEQFKVAKVFYCSITAENDVIITIKRSQAVKLLTNYLDKFHMKPCMSEDKPAILILNNPDLNQNSQN